MFPRDIFSELARLQREIQQNLDPGPSIRGFGRGGFPAVNVGGTSQSLEVYAFAPGLDPTKTEVHLERGVLTISGERPVDLPEGNGKVAVHINERFAGRFRRAISVPDDIDPNSVSAEYRDGILHISLKRHESAQPRRITIH
jgi:HSP20 family protein